MSFRPACIKQDGSFSHILQRYTFLKTLGIGAKQCFLLAEVTTAQKGQNGGGGRKVMSLLVVVS